MYVTKMILGGRPGGHIEATEEVLMPHHSMAELVSYLKFNNLIIGKPQAYTPYVSIEHADGSSLTPEELNRLKEEGITQEGYRSRIQEAVPNEKLPESALDPELGAAHVVLLRAMTSNK